MAVVFDEAVFGLAAGIVALALAGIAARIETERRRARRRSGRRASRPAERTPSARTGGGRAVRGVVDRRGARRGVGRRDLPPGTDTEEWEIDPVSGLLRERHLPVLLPQAVASARRKVQPVAVVFWQLDGFEAAPEEPRRGRHRARCGGVAHAARATPCSASARRRPSACSSTPPSPAP